MRWFKRLKAKIHNWRLKTRIQNVVFYIVNEDGKFWHFSGGYTLWVHNPNEATPETYQEAIEVVSSHPGALLLSPSQFLEYKKKMPHAYPD